MTFCDNCHCQLGSDTAITTHLAKVHCIHVKLGSSETTNLSYCEDCKKYLGKKRRFNNRREALEKHLEKHHNIHMHEGYSEMSY